MGKVNKADAGAPLPEKVLLLYQAVVALIEEGADIAGITVADITKKAGIGKGTAYEYFDSKEEIISGALLYFMEEFMARMAGRLHEEKGLESCLDLILDMADKSAGKTACILRYLNLFIDPSGTGKLLREALADHKRQTCCRPYQMLYGMIERGVEKGEIRQDKPIEYLTYVLISKLAAYLAFLAEPHDDKKKPRLSAAEFRRCVAEGILEELSAS